MGSGPRSASSIHVPVLTHIAELRTRLLWSAASILVFSTAAYFVRDTLLALLLQPLGRPLYYTTPSGGLEFLFNVCLAVGILGSLPVIAYHTTRFVAPALPSRIEISLVRIVAASCFLVLLGLAFAYAVAIPVLLRFLSSFSSPQVEPLLSTNEYLGFVLQYLVGFGLLFQLPLVVLGAGRLFGVGPRWFVKQERYVIVASFVAGFVLAPDPVSQFLFALPIIALYQVAVGVLWFSQRSAGRQRQRQPRTAKHHRETARRAS